VYWGLVDKISPARLRVEKLGCLISTCGSSHPGSIHPLAQRLLRPEWWGVWGGSLEGRASSK
jgi:hypothetical protein